MLSSSARDSAILTLAVLACFALTAARLLAPLPASAAEEELAAKPAPAIELGAPFTDNAILQREMEVPVWGWCTPGTAVTVEFGGQKVQAVAGTDGDRMVIEFDHAAGLKTNDGAAPKAEILIMAPMRTETCLTALTTSSFSPESRPFVVNAVRRVGHNENRWRS